MHLDLLKQQLDIRRDDSHEALELYVDHLDSLAVLLILLLHVPVDGAMCLGNKSLIFRDVLVHMINGTTVNRDGLICMRDGLSR